MKPHPEYERLNDHLQKHLARRFGNEQVDPSHDPVLLTEKDPEIDALVAQTQHLQVSPALQVNADFARRLEQRMLLHHLALGRQHTTKPQGSRFFSHRFVAYISMALVLLCSLFTTSMFALAAHVTNPSNPLYPVKQWEQQVQLSLARSPSDQAQVSLQIVRDRLNTLAQIHGETYRQALVDLSGQIDALAQLLKALPARSDRQHLTDELATLKASARQVLRDGLSHRSLPERLLTTNELAQLGDTVTQLDHARIVFSPSSPTQATISLTGNHLAPGGHALIDQVLTGANGKLENGTEVFMVNWQRQATPQTIGVLNLDGTVAQTTVILFANAKDTHNNNNTQIDNGKGDTSGNMHTNNNSNGASGNKQNGNTTNNESNNHGNKNNEIQPSPSPNGAKKQLPS